METAADALKWYIEKADKACDDKGTLSFKDNYTIKYIDDEISELRRIVNTTIYNFWQSFSFGSYFIGLANRREIADIIIYNFDEDDYFSYHSYISSKVSWKNTAWTDFVDIDKFSVWNNDNFYFIVRGEYKH